MLKQPLITKLEQANNILIAGAGGGFDIFCGLPLFFALLAEGKNVHLANLSFTILAPLKNDQLPPSMVRVTSESDVALTGPYFPEKYLAQWLEQEAGLSMSIYAFERTGVKPLLDNYHYLVDELSIDTVILVDGGTDSLMRGDEDGLGTPQEDVVSIAAVNQLDDVQKMLVCLGFGVDHFHGVSNFLTFKAIADLTQTDDFLGTLSLLKTMPEVQQYRAAAEYVFQRMPNNTSIVSSSILAAIAGEYGDFHSTPRTKRSKLWINPLMAMYFGFDLDAVAKRLLYLDAIKETKYYRDIDFIINEFRQNYLDQIISREKIPD